MGSKRRHYRRWGLTSTSLDPYDANDTLSQAVAKSFYQGLFGFDKNLKLVNVLAESYTVSKDGLVYTIKLHPGSSSRTAPTSTPKR
ncbi:Glutathione-binding protein gsiB precursor [Ewingella americana]|uniref:Glutathione-binding protein gsiB n=1 Tax=Ewingella americana TaxID=41202 RepID=A0A377NFE2_9GAMM|nr:Glutathione-binding protein gsiB precursor [Ewingella americana]